MGVGSALLRHRNGNIVFVLLVVPCLLGVAWFDKRTADGVRASATARFEARSEIRHGRIVRELESRHQLLTSVTALFAGSSSVEQDEFITFIRSLAQKAPPAALCWTSPDAQTSFVQTTRLGLAAERLCGKFDLLEPSRIVSDEKTWIVFSAPASSQEQRGYASVVFDMESLFLEDSPPELAEYLIVSDAIKNTVATYIYRQAELSRVKLSPPQNPQDVLYFQLARFGEASFVYITVRKSPEDSATGYRAASVVGLIALSLLGAFLVRDLLIKRAIIIEEVRERTDELSQFAYRTSHDLRAPLVTVGGLCRVVQDDLAEGDLDEVEANVVRISEHVGRLDKLVGDIIEMTRADLAANSREPIDFEAFLEEVVRTVEMSFGEHGVAIETSVATTTTHHLPRIRLVQIVENLLSNGVKYRKRGITNAFVHIEISDLPHLTIAVRDNGLGIPARFHNRLFRMFERFHQAVPGVGSGLGLAIVKKHVDRLGGHVVVDSTSAGTTFTVHIPESRENSS